MQIRPATVADVPAMCQIIRDSAELGLMLSKSHSELYETVRAFQVAENNDGKVVGLCALSIIWASIAEVASLAVLPETRGQGVGKKLVQACLDEAQILGIRKVITLTYQQVFFEKLGFAVVDRMTLPHKVWSVCVRCPKHDACDEIAMMLEYAHIPEPEVPAPPKDVDYEAPVILTRKGQAL